MIGRETPRRVRLHGKDYALVRIDIEENEKHTNKQKTRRRGRESTAFVGSTSGSEAEATERENGLYTWEPASPQPYLLPCRVEKFILVGVKREINLIYPLAQSLFVSFQYFRMQKLTALGSNYMLPYLCKVTASTRDNDLI